MPIKLDTNTAQKKRIMATMRTKFRNPNVPGRGFMHTDEWLTERGFKPGYVYAGYYIKADKKGRKTKVYVCRTFAEMKRMTEDVIRKTDWQMTEAERASPLTNV